ncbi:MAG TPA: DUF4337 family protein [Candidatus Angelobacter sp.]|nr:DUF4337 family protein [Candidatus Angelobacter sp.]
MSETNEFVEHMEHAGHGGHEHGGMAAGIGKYVGITMATLGVLLALGSALVGSQRTELIATMVEQTNAGTKYQALSTKYRVLLAQLQQLHSLSPDPELFKKWDDEVHKLQGQVSSADMSRVVRIIRLENAKNLNAEIPTQSDLQHFVTVINGLDKEQEAAREWTESYDSAVAAHARAAEHYEWAQLASEMGIVIASIALLFMNRPAWFAAVLLGIATLVLAGMTFVSVTGQLHTAEKRIEEAKARFESFDSDSKGKAADEELLKAVEHDQQPNVDPK